VDRLIDLVKTRKEINRALFLDLVQPAFQAFEAVHTDYIDSLMRYNTRLADTKVPMDLDHPVFDEIDLDSLKSGHLRTKLKDFRPKDSSPKLTKFLTAIDFYLRGISASGDHAELVHKIATSNSKSLMSEDLKGLRVPVGSIEFYIESLKDVPMVFSDDPMRLALRNVLVGLDAPLPSSDLEERELLEEGAGLWAYQTDEQRRLQCAYAIQSTMREFQFAYATVSAEYSALRAELMI
jgi:hypothetical protein